MRPLITIVLLLSAPPAGTPATERASLDAQPSEHRGERDGEGSPPDDDPNTEKLPSELPSEQAGRSPRVPRGEVEVSDRTIVVTTGTRTQRDATTVPVATQVITREEIVASGSETVAEALEESGASIQIGSGIGGSSLSLRGLGAEQVLITIDGQRVTGRIGGTLDLSRFTVENVERIEVVLGSGSVLYGSDALGGVINIVTRRAEPGVQAQARVSYGSRNTFDSSGRVAGGGRRYGLSAHGGYHRSDGWDADPSDIATTGDALGQWNVGAGAWLLATSALRLSLNADYLRRDTRGIGLTGSGAIIDRRNLTETLDGGLSSEWTGADSRLRVDLHYNLFRDQFQEDQRGDDALDRYQPTRDQLGQIVVQYDQLIGKHVLTSGADLQLEWLVTDRIQVGEGGPDGAQRQRVALFVQDEWTPTLTPRVAILPAARIDYDSRFGLYPTGRLALLVAPTETFSLRAAYGRGYRAPSFREMFLAFSNPGVGYRVRGNPELRPEQAWTLDLGATWRPIEALSLGLGVFDNQLRDLMTVDLVAEGGVGTLDEYSYINIGAAYTRGVEASAELEFARWFEVHGSYTYMRAQNLLDDLPLPGRAAHQGTFSFQFHHPRWGTRAMLRARVQGRRPQAVTTDSIDYAAAYATADLRVSQSFLRYFSAHLGVENLFDAGDATTTPLAPRSFYGGLSFRY